MLPLGFPRSQSLPELYVVDHRPLKLEDCGPALRSVERFFPTLEIATLVEKVKNTLKDYASNIFENDLEVQIDEKKLELIKFELLRASQELSELPNIPPYSLLLEYHFADCQACLDSLLLDHSEQKGWIANIWGMFQQSTKLQEIKWKFKKYETLILTLLDFMKKIPGKPVEVLRNQLILPQEYSKMMQAKNPIRFTIKNLNALRTLYTNHFIEEVRIQICLYPEDPGLLEVCYHLFCNISLDDENHSILDLFESWGAKCLQEKKLESIFKHPVVQEIDFLHQKVHAVPNTAKAPIVAIGANSLRGIVNRDFDPGVQGNPMHRLYILQIEKKSVYSLGFGSPTIEELSVYNSAQLNPEFQAFLRHCKKNNKKHLFITNQDATSNGNIQAEKQRCDLVIDLQEKEIYRGTFFAIALSKNSHFYEQKKREYPNATSFISDLLGQFNDPLSGCIIPESIMNILGNDLKNIATAIHENLFMNRDILEKQERLIFIEVFYDQLTKWLIWKLDIDSFNISCKDAIDRGAASNAQLYAHLSIVNNQFEGEHLKRTTVLMMVRALLVRKRAPIRERVLRFLHSLDFFLDNPDKMRSLHTQLFGTKELLPLKP